MVGFWPLAMRHFDHNMPLMGLFARCAERINHEGRIALPVMTN
jgi:hypothetical protein